MGLDEIVNIESIVDVNTIAQQLPNKGTAFDACEGHYILDEQGEPVVEPDLFKWAEWLEEAYRTRSRHLADDTIGPYRVSTVFLGLDQSFGDGPPVLWETMIFGMDEEYVALNGKRKRSRKSLDTFRYTSKAEALDGHARAVKLAESLPQLVGPAVGSGAE